MRASIARVMRGFQQEVEAMEFPIHRSPTGWSGSPEADAQWLSGGFHS